MGFVPELAMSFVAWQGLGTTVDRRGVALPRLEIDPLTLEGENPKMFAGVVDEIVVAEA